MRDVRDQLSVLLVRLQLLLLGFLKPKPHLFKCLHQLTELVMRLRLQCEIKVTTLDPLRRLLQLIHRLHDAHINPADEK